MLGFASVTGWAKTIRENEAKNQMPALVDQNYLTQNDLINNLREQGASAEQIKAVLADIKLTIEPEELGETRESVNARAAKAFLGSSGIVPQTANIIQPNIDQSNMIDDRVTYGSVTNDNQYFRYYGSHWYHNQAPGGCTFGYWDHYGYLRYKKYANPNPNMTNFSLRSQASFCWRDNNTQWTHLAVLYEWTGSNWMAIWSNSQSGNASDIYQTQSDFNQDFRLVLNRPYLLGTNLYANGWNPSGWPAQRTKHVSFSLAP